MLDSWNRWLETHEDTQSSFADFLNWYFPEGGNI